MAPKRKNISKPAVKKAKIEDKPRTEEDIKLESILNALRNEEYPIEGPPANREMLIAGAPSVFAEYIEDRHANQIVMTGFLDSAFAGIRTFLSSKVDEQLRIQETGETRRLELVAASDTAKIALDEKTVALEQLEEARTAKKTLLTEARDNLKAAKNAQKGIDSELANAQCDVDKFARGLELFTTIKLSGPDKNSLKEIKPIIFNFPADPGMISPFDAVSRPLNDRGMFENLVLESLEKNLNDKIAAAQALIEEIKTRGQDIIANTEACEAKVTEATTILTEAEEAVTAAKTAKTEASVFFKDSEKAISQHDSDVASAGDRKVECESSLAAFELIEADFAWLKARTAPKPEPEIVEEEKPVEAAPADVEMAPAAETTAETVEAPVLAEETAVTDASLEAPIEEVPIVETEILMEPMLA